MIGREVLPSKVYLEHYDTENRFKITLSEVFCEYKLSQPTEIFNLSMHKMKVKLDGNLKT